MSFDNGVMGFRMIRARSILICIFVCLVFASTANAQKHKTVILVRHAEKETSDTADSMDPPLSPAGEARAQLLVKRVGKYRPGAIYSTDLKRTRATVEPLAKKRGLITQIYDPAKPQDLVNIILSSKTKRIVIVGHSNTISPLANLIIGKDLFKNLQDPEYSVIWVIKLRDGKVKKTEILSY